MLTPPESHFVAVADAIREGDVVPLLGAGANLCGRPPDTSWEPGETLPTGTELADYLARHFKASVEDEELARVSQWVALVRGYAPLYRELHELFDADYEPTALHRFLASLPRRLRAQRAASTHQLIVSTNYDDALERAFGEAGEPFDLVSYKAEGDHRGKFVHWPPGEEARVIEIPNEYAELSLDERTVILKLHGLVERHVTERVWESFVITEDHYIEYLTRANVAEYLPSALAEKLHNCNLLFLGYSMRDWNLRVILHRIWSERDLSWSSWAVQRAVDDLDERFWRHRGVDLFDVSLEDYLAELEAHLRVAANDR